MFKHIRIFFKLVAFFIVGLIGFISILMYLGSLSFYPFKYKFEFYNIYFFITLILLPFFRITHMSWFKSSDDQFVTYKQRALDMHQQDIAQNHKNRKWSSNGVSVNPWEYTTTTTLTYGNSAGWGYSLAKSLFMSTVFIIFAPIFYFVSFLKSRR
ncbi:hypothetical protein [Liquorilactobacillus uvarum]|uniref:DUF3899 domain-containing protein n=1 Tax=Liquorilactobacillus uvarum DSM 19971 TaxID=1423812 RepID=A0A0R1Q392_9LACO|nr:hypothetical protein [Liquorilactobacillus uvarum]KRL39009.1 hypothetical protein FD20_GL000047 [Liquorilactobacillus uvarum DSM 19971]